MPRPRFLLALLGIIGPTACQDRAPAAPEPAATPEGGVAAVLRGIPADRFQELSEADGAAIYREICAACHGADGSGQEALRAPSIAGLPAWYTRPQMVAFRTGRRGADPGDTAGGVMRSIADRLTGAMTTRVVEHLATMPPARTNNTLGGDPARGRVEYDAHCASCHRFDASGDRVFDTPPLRVLPDWYMLEQMQAYHDGRRGTHRRDEAGQKMVLVAEHVRDPGRLRDILAYVAALAGR